MKNERGYNWTQAKSVCIELNAELASFMSAEENEFIMGNKFEHSLFLILKNFMKTS